MTEPERRALEGTWIRSHEEDSGEEMVFRPALHELPPARGRTEIELRADGSYRERSPGPVDVPEESGGRWTLQGDRLTLEAEGDRPRRSWRVTAAEPDRLTVRRG